MHRIHKVILSIEGMSCASSAKEIEEVLKAEPGVFYVHVNFATEKVSIEFDSKVISLYELGKKIEEKGCTPVLTDPKDKTSKEAGKLKRAKVRLILSLVFVLPIIVLMLFEMVGRPLWLSSVWIVLLAAPVVFMIGNNIFAYAAKSLMRFKTNTDVLIAIGMLAAFSTGVLRLLGFGIENYAGVAAMIMVFHLGGKYLGLLAQGQTFSPINRLEELGAKEAHLIIEKGLRDIPIEDLRLGDILLVKPGEKIPIDSEVLEGISSVDESLLTGESMPLLKRAGEKLIGGTVNKEGFLKIKVTKIGTETFLASVIRLIEDCQATKVPIQGMADSFTNVFVPVVLLLSIATFGLWYRFFGFFLSIIEAAKHFLPLIHPERDLFSLAVFAAVAVLVIACPVALGLAAPTALLVGAGVGAKQGILIRRGDAVQNLSKVNTIVFDKTGTLTKGIPEVTDIILNSKFNYSEEQLLFYAGSLEVVSDHPLAAAILDKAKNLRVELEHVAEFEGTPGKGLRGRVKDRYVIIGNQKQMLAFGIQVNGLNGALEKLAQEGKTTVLVSVDSEVVGALALADTLKPRVKSVISELKNMGINPIMITGDHKLTADVIAKKAGIEEVFSEVFPADKAEKIKELQNQGRRVAMVGDGVNDAPALAQADVGIALGSGTDFAIGAGDIILIPDDLRTVISAIKLSRSIFSKIKQNLFWALFYNLVALPIAIFGLLHPALATGAMAISSLNVVSNSLSLKKVKIR